MKNLLHNRKLVISVMVILIVLATLIALGPMLYSLFMGRGVKTEPINAAEIKPASRELAGEWTVTKGRPHNHTSVGFTFDEVLPAEKTRTSGSTTSVTGHATIEGETLTAGEITVDMNDVSTDKKVRDQNMRTKLFVTAQYPQASFHATKPADLSDVPDDGTVGTVALTGELTIKGQTHEVSQDFDIARDRDEVVLSGTIPINRLDYGVKTPEFVAAKIAEEGEVNVRITFAPQNAGA